jgi:uncharacterized repeat protein (TIGR03803 family)
MPVLRFRIFLTLLLVAIALSTTSAQTFTVLHSFAGGTDGQTPATGLVLDQNGNLYGTTFGLLDGSKPTNYGTVFKIDKNGNETILKRFHGPNGSNPLVGYLLLDEKTLTLYGTADIGGTLPGGTPGAGGGTVFALDIRHHKLTTLYTFTGLLDGGSPRGSLVRTPTGAIFGTTLGGGTNSYGTVFRINKAGRQSVIHNFHLARTGIEPADGLISDAQGNLYGVTWEGLNNSGVVFKMNQVGNETVLHEFTGGADGATPSSQLFLDAAGNLYGTTEFGGANNLGTIFKIDPNGQETVLHSFSGPLQNDGANPVAGLVRDDAGNFYGTTWAGGIRSNFGTVYKMDTTGQVTILYTFPSTNPIGSPSAGLARDADGNLYGVTSPNPIFPIGFGTVFKLTP